MNLIATVAILTTLCSACSLGFTSSPNKPSSNRYSPKPAHISQLLKTKQCPGCKLDGATLKGADLKGANLQGAELSRADLSGADLREADLIQGVNLQGADLVKANPNGADLSGAILSGAKLRSANLDGANLEDAVDLNKPLSTQVNPASSQNFSKERDH